MEQENQYWQNTPEPEEEIDLMELAGRLWMKRKLILKAGLIGAVIGLVVAFSIPKEYAVTVTLSPESGKSSASGLASAASMLGLGNLQTGVESDALNIMLFPDILASDPFALELYEMEVTNKDGEQMPLNEYMETQRTAWWGWLLRLPFKVVGAMLHSDDGEVGTGTPDPFRLSKKETSRLKAIKESMSAVVDKKTGVTTITVTLQDALVSATVADSVVSKLQDYITAYRTKKAVDDSEYLEKLYRDRQQEYYEAQQNYATYVDGNKSLYTQRSMVERERLQNDMNQAYQIYNQVASQLQVARAKIQEAKPVFAVVNPATVPVQSASPNKKLILVAFVFLACAIVAAWVLFGEGLWDTFKKTISDSDKNESEENEE